MSIDWGFRIIFVCPNRFGNPMLEDAWEVHIFLPFLLILFWFWIEYFKNELEIYLLLFVMGTKNLQFDFLLGVFSLVTFLQKGTHQHTWNMHLPSMITIERNTALLMRVNLLVGLNCPLLSIPLAGWKVCYDLHPIDSFPCFFASCYHNQFLLFWNDIFQISIFVIQRLM